jgi:hypothetical protein
MGDGRADKGPSRTGHRDKVFDKVGWREGGWHSGYFIRNIVTTRVNIGDSDFLSVTLSVTNRNRRNALGFTSSNGRIVRRRKWELSPNIARLKQWANWCNPSSSAG